MIEFRNALIAENIRTESGGYPGVICDPSNLKDGHVFLNWKQYLRNTEFLKMRYQKSVGIMTKVVHVDISPLLTDEDINDIINAVHKAANAIL